MALIIGCDHGGFALKEALLPYLTEEMGYEIEDIGCHSAQSVDYSDIAIELAKRVANGEFEQGIIICGTGIGVSMAANKVKGIRCALCSDETSARLAREHNDANVLALGGRIIGTELAKGIVAAFLATDFSYEKRHILRINKFMDYEA